MKIKIYNEDYAIVKSKKPYPKAFANIISDSEITVIIDERKVENEDIIESEKGWKLITFDDVLDFSLVGFIAKVSKALANEKISIFVVSAYSTDHILVKKQNFEKAIKILKNLNL